MKIGELVKQTGVSKESIHHYIREGLLPKPRKTARNTAEYDERFVEQTLLIKELRDNYFLPLHLIGKIIQGQRKKPPSERHIFQMQNEYFRPVERFFPRKIEGRDEFRKITGLNAYWLKQMEAWRIVTPRNGGKAPQFDQKDVILGKLIVEMDRLGFGPREGHDPAFLKELADFLRNSLAGRIKNYLAENIDKLNSADFQEKGLHYTEVMSLFLYHLFRKIIEQEYSRFVKTLDEIDSN